MLKKRKLQIVLVNNLPPEKIEQVINSYKNLELKFVRGDFTQESILEKANIRQAKEVVILPDETLSPYPSFLSRMFCHSSSGINGIKG